MHDEVWIYIMLSSIRFRYSLGGIDPRGLLVSSLQQYIFFLFTSMSIDNELFRFQLAPQKKDGFGAVITW